MSYMTTDNLVRDILFSIGDRENREYPIVFRQVVRSYKDLKLNVIFPTKTNTSKILSDYTINCPEDCLEVYRVGHINNDRTITLYGNEKLYINEECNCCNCTNTAQKEDNPPCDNWYFYDSYYGEMYAYRTDYHDNGKWDYDKEKNRIIFSTGYQVYEGADVIFSYKSKEDDLKVIPEEYYEIIRYHVLWNYYQARNTRQADYFRSMLRIAVANFNRMRNDKVSNEDILAGWVGSKNTP